MKDSVKFCPTCGSASVEFSSLVGGQGSCKGCGWVGNADELLVVPIEHDFAGKEGMLVSMMNDVRKFMSGELGQPWLRFLLKWGFLEADVNNLLATLDRKKFARYLAVIGQSVVAALIAERARQSQPKEGEGNAPTNTN